MGTGVLDHLRLQTASKYVNANPAKRYNTISTCYILRMQLEDYNLDLLELDECISVSKRKCHKLC